MDLATRDLKTRIENDFALSQLLPGGVYIDADPAGFPLTPSKNQAAYEEVSGQSRLLPCAVITESSVVPSGPGTPASGGQRITLRVGFYQPSGYERIRHAQEHMRVLLDPSERGEQFGPLADGRYYIVRYLDTPVRNAIDDSIISADAEGGVAYEAQRYSVDIAWLYEEEEG